MRKVDPQRIILIYLKLEVVIIVLGGPDDLFKASLVHSKLSMVAMELKKPIATKIYLEYS